jgi:signal transduction histidine kinase
MSDPSTRVTEPHDPKGRLISIFVGAVLLPSLALSYVSIEFVPQLAKANKEMGFKRAANTLADIEKDLARAAQAKALEAAQAVGWERLLDGRQHVIAEALEGAGLDGHIFDTLHLEGASSPRRDWTRAGDGRAQSPRDILHGLGLAAPRTEDAMPWVDADGKASGVLRFRFKKDYIRSALIPDYFAHDFPNPDQAIVVRVVADDGSIVHETAPTPSDARFEVERALDTPSLRGLRLALRYKDLSIEQDVRRWERGTLALIAFIDLMLGAGLFLVYSNVRREAHLSRLKSDFVANVSHELKTPLALIRLFAETLELGRVPTEDKARQYYRVINKESQRLTQLINNILDFSRIEAGRKEYRFAPTNVGRIVSEVLEAYRFQIEQQGFELKVEVEPDLPEVEADSEALGQALLNLVNNAIKYSRETRSLTLAVRSSPANPGAEGTAGDRVSISVTDRGIGVPRAEQRKIFEKFYRGEASLVHETKGSGLGLSLVEHIMEAHGGSVEIESTPGKGSTFTLVLPITRKKKA